MNKNNKYLTILFSAAGILLTLCFFNGCKSKPQTYSCVFFAMDTYMSLQCSGEPSCETVLEKAKSEVYRLETLFDPNISTSDIARINQNAGTPVSVSEDTARIIAESVRISGTTDDSFNVLLRPLIELWGFGTEYPCCPKESEIHKILPVGLSGDISMQNQNIMIPGGSGMDLGAVAKGYCSDRIRDLFVREGIQSALVSLGGNVMALGHKPDGSEWKIAIQDPKEPGSIIGIVSGHDFSVITSGSYQRFFEENGTLYHHILDPITGYPANSGLSSVTVISKDGTYADALATAFFVMGEEKAITEYDRLSPDIKPDAVIFVSQEGTVTVQGTVDFSPAENIICKYL